jgi:uncharacterized protein YggU (UPF0235/DUF167 family)
VTPNAAQDRIEGIDTLANGSPVLKLRIRARPQDGDANEAVLKLLAKSFALRRFALRLTQGATARVKTVAVTGDLDSIIKRLGELA